MNRAASLKPLFAFHSLSILDKGRGRGHWVALLSIERWAWNTVPLWVIEEVVVVVYVNADLEWPSIERFFRLLSNHCSIYLLFFLYFLQTAAAAAFLLPPVVVVDVFVFLFLHFFFGLLLLKVGPYLLYPLLCFLCKLLCNWTITLKDTVNVSFFKYVDGAISVAPDVRCPPHILENSYLTEERPFYKLL